MRLEVRKYYSEEMERKLSSESYKTNVKCGKGSPKRRAGDRENK